MSNPRAPGGSRGAGWLRQRVLPILVVSLLLAPPVRASTATSTSLELPSFVGMYAFVATCVSGCVGVYDHTLTISSYDAATGSFSGTGVSGAIEWTISGTITGGEVTFHIVYTAGNPGYTFDGTGTASPDGSTMEGTGIDFDPNRAPVGSLTWQATRTIPSSTSSSTSTTSSSTSSTTSTSTSTTSTSTTSSTFPTTRERGPDCSVIWRPDVATENGKLGRGDQTAVAVAGMNIGTAATTCRVTLAVKPVGKGGRADIRPVSSLSVALEPGGTVQPIFLVGIPLHGAADQYRLRGCVADTDRHDLNPRNECADVLAASAEAVTDAFIDPLPNTARPPRFTTGPDCAILWVESATVRSKLLRGDQTAVAVTGWNAGNVATTCHVTLAAERLSGGEAAQVAPADGYSLTLAPGQAVQPLFMVELPLHGAAPRFRLRGCVDDTDTAGDLRPGNECFAIDSRAADTVMPDGIEPVPHVLRPPLATAGPDCAAIRIEVGGGRKRLLRGTETAVTVSGWNAGTASASCRATLTAEPLSSGGPAEVQPSDGYAVPLAPGGVTSQRFRLAVPADASTGYRLTGCVSDTDASDIRPWNECTTVSVQTR